MGLFRKRYHRNQSESLREEENIICEQKSEVVSDLDFEHQSAAVSARMENLYRCVCEYIDIEYRDPSHIRFSLKEETDPVRLEIRHGKLVLVPDDGTAPTFSNEVKRIMAEKKIDGPELCRRILMDRRLYSKMTSDFNYQPSKETALAVCVGLHLTENEARVLLDRAGFSLSCFSQMDVIIQYFLQNKLYNIDDINEMLYRFGHKCIGTNVRV